MWNLSNVTEYVQLHRFRESSSSKLSIERTHAAVICVVVFVLDLSFDDVTELFEALGCAMKYKRNDKKKKDGEMKNRRKQYTRRPNICCL